MQINEWLAKFQGPIICGITTVTVHTNQKIPNRVTGRLLKHGRDSGRPCPHTKVYRCCRRNGIIGCSYENCVNNQRGREGQPVNRNDVVLYFKALELWNGQGEHDGPYTVRHIKNHRRYLAFKPTQKPNGSVINHDDVWMDENGNVLNKANLTEFLPIVSESSRQQVDRPVLWRTISLDNIVAVTYGGEEILMS